LIDWGEITKVELTQNVDGTMFTLGVFAIWSQPYSFHSLSIEFVPSMADLIDVSVISPIVEEVIYWNGELFKNHAVGFFDSTYFAFYSDSTVYSDTVFLAFHYLADSATYAMASDSSNYSDSVMTASISESSNYSDSSVISYLSTGNWRLSGDEIMEEDKYFGTTSLFDLYINTNANNRLILGENGLRDEFTKQGFNVHTTKGFLGTPISGTLINDISETHLYL
jgi:hypothetical protein